MAKRTRQQTRKRAAKGRPGVAIYHDMKVYENFERSALRIFQMVQRAEKDSPGAPRHLFIDVQGHKNSVGGYDHDAFELIHDFALVYLGKYLTEVSTPLIHVRIPDQRNDLPHALQFGYPDDGSEYGYDAEALGIQPREAFPAERKSPPTVRAIADYLGLEEAGCLICWAKPVERAHVVPHALGGSMDVRNFALLCRKHHAEAPDVADAESFWAWVDYAELRDTPDKWADAPDELKKFLRQHNVRVDGSRREDLSFFSAVKDELGSLYGWSDGDFAAVQWAELMDEFHRVLDAATGRHFSIDKKVSTYAWAYDIAFRRAKGEASAVIRDKP
ncbi:HNH endonuclease signature motif containing protein [Streptomyces sp. NPDC056401]|uniref:HNH endonuclease signature motif containing protein n=1 Tax=Streptomyces sp. NPDC056401 TaxID=3345809 RepID=UPI0035D685D0